MIGTQEIFSASTNHLLIRLPARSIREILRGDFSAKNGNESIGVAPDHRLRGPLPQSAESEKHQGVTDLCITNTLSVSFFYFAINYG